MFRNTATLTLMLCAIFFWQSALATSKAEVTTMDILVDDSSAILIGKRVKQETVNNNGEIKTFNHVQVSQWLAGNGPAEIAVVTPGGMFESPTGIKLSKQYPGFPIALPNQEVVLFLKQQGNEGYALSHGDASIMHLLDRNGELQIAPIVSDQGAMTLEALSQLIAEIKSQ